MTGVRRHPLPSHSLLTKVAHAGNYTDCYVAAVPLNVTHAEFVEAFYTSWLFKLERLFLAWTVDKPSTDAEARDLARGARDRFAAWSVDARIGNQVVMLDYLSYTCSWLMVEERPADTLLYFGTGIFRKSFAFRALVPFHRLYARALLSAAGSRLRRTPTF